MKTRILLIFFLTLIAAPLWAQQPVKLVDNTGTDVPLATTTEGQHDVALTPASTKALLDMCRASTATPSSVSADDDAVLAWCLRDGRRVVTTIDPCNSEVKSSTAISQTARTVIVTATASKKTYICSLVLVATAAEIVSVLEGTGTTCQTSTVAIAGSTTAANGMSLAINGVLSVSGNGSTLLAGTGTNVDVCLVPSGSGRVTGWVTWVQK